MEPSKTTMARAIAAGAEAVEAGMAMALTTTKTRMTAISSDSWWGARRARRWDTRAEDNTIEASRTL